MARPHMSRAIAVVAAETEEGVAASEADSVEEAAGWSEGSPPFSCDGCGEATIGADGDGARDGGDREGTEAAGAGTGVGGATVGAGDGAALEGAGDGAGDGVATEREGDGTGDGVAAECDGAGVATDGATAAGVGEGLPTRMVLRGAMTTVMSFSPFRQLVSLPLMK